jgi:serine/threonine protein phosphatase 1
MGVRDFFGIGRRAKEPPRPPCAPRDTVLYAVGDIHGRSDLLQNLLVKIGADASQNETQRKILIYDGD